MKDDALHPGRMSVAHGASRHAGRRETRQRPTRGNALGAPGAANAVGVSVRGGRWRVQPGPLLSAEQKDWVSRGGSLTAHLARLGPVSVRVLRETIAAAWPDENACLQSAIRGGRARHRTSVSGGATRSSGRGTGPAGPVRSVSSAHAIRPLRVWTREVLLSVNDVPCVAAHSVTAVTHSRGVWKSIRVLRTRPLADLLYHDPAVRRSLLVSRRLAVRRVWSSTDPLAGLPLGAGDAGAASDAGASHRMGFDRYPVVARRSLFERRGAPLMITECFLPALWHLLENRRASRPLR